MTKAGIDQDAIIEMFATASAKGTEQVRKSVGDATLAAVQGIEDPQARLIAVAVLFHARKASPPMIDSTPRTRGRNVDLSMSQPASSAWKPKKAIAIPAAWSFTRSRSSDRSFKVSRLNE